MGSTPTSGTVLTSKQQWKKKSKEKTQEEYCKYLLDNPCLDCGEDDILVLEPDHLKDKKYNISHMIKVGYTWKSVLKELEKCEIVCRNCHHRRTHKRQESFKVRFLSRSTPIW